MNVKLLKSGFALVAAFSVSSSFAEPLPDWVSSYSANGVCYCAPTVHPALRNKIVPTPVGGQSISQVCGRIGAGPGLQLDGGLFNYPAYHDAQCGNGPYGADPEGCEGRMQADDAICTGSGPEWDLKTAYARPAQPRAEIRVSQAEQTKVINESRAEPAVVVKRETPVRSDQEDAALALELAAQARIKSQQQSEQQSQELEQARAEAEQARQAVEAQQLAAQQEQQRQAAAAREELAAQQREQQQRLAAEQRERLAAEQREKLAAEQRERLAAEQREKLAAEQYADREKKLARARAAKARAALQQTFEETPADQQLEKTVAEQAGQQLAEPTPALAASSAAQSAVDAVDDETNAINRIAANKAAQQSTLADADNIKDEQLLSSARTVENVESTAEPALEAATASAIKLPAAVAKSDTQGGFVELAPISYDFGGAGASLGGGLLMGTNWQFVGRAAVVQEYTEAMLGVSRSFAPAALKGARLRVLGAMEYGNFDLGVTDLSDSGFLLGTALDYRLNHTTSLSAGINYSSFFEGDPAVFGHLLFRFIDNLDFSTRVEGGDNANLSLGLRYHY